MRDSQSLGYQHRLHYSWEYRRFFNQSDVFRLSECTVFRVKNDLGFYRLGITLKARGSSIDRNKVKRQIRESIRSHAGSLGSYDYNVVIPATKRLAFPYPEKLGKTLRRDIPQSLILKAK